MKDHESLVGKILRRCAELGESHNNWESLWKDASKYCLPRVEDSIDNDVVMMGGQRKGEQLYDSAPIKYAERLANSIFSYSTPPTVNFFDLTTGNEQMDAKKEVSDYLRQCSSVLHYTLHTSNFYPEMHSCFQDAVVLGSLVMGIEEDENSSVRYSSLPIYKTKLGLNALGETNTLHIKYRFNRQQLKERFPNKYEELKDIDDSLNNDFEVIHIIEPVEHYFDERKTGMKPFVSWYFFTHKNIILNDITDGFLEFPYAVAFWSKVSGENYGRSPAMRALPDIKSLNVLKSVILKSAQISLAPPLQVPHNGLLKGARVKFKPFGLTMVRGDREIKPLVAQSRYDVGTDTLDRLYSNISDTFYINALDTTDKTHQLQQQVANHSQEQMRDLSAVFIRMIKGVEHIINRSFAILDRQGKLPDAPEVLRDFPNLEIRYKSQLAKSQDELEVQSIGRSLELLMPIFQAFPDTSTAVNGVEAIRYIIEKLGLDQRILNSEAEIQKKQKDMQEQQQQQQDQEQLLAQSQAVSNMS